MFDFMRGSMSASAIFPVPIIDTLEYWFSFGTSVMVVNEYLHVLRIVLFAHSFLGSNLRYDMFISL